jgi:hypothetical protein
MTLEATPTELESAIQRAKDAPVSPGQQAMFGEWQPETLDFTLNPRDPFEAELIEIAKMYRIKTAEYANSDDPEQAFTDIGHDVGQEPLTVCETLGAKHRRSIGRYLRTRERTKGSDDAFTDRAVYAVHSSLLYRRETHG